MSASKRALLEAEKWLIEHNHHGCHLLVDEEDGQRASGEMPLPADIEELAKLLDSFGGARVKAFDAINTCVVCECSLVEIPEDPPHCLDCSPHEEHIENWEETASRLQHALGTEDA